MTRVRTLALAASLAAVAACVDFGVETGEIGSVEIVPPPAPALVAGDTLRNAAGVAAPIEVRVYSAGGELMTGRTVRFVATDTVVTVSEGGFVVGRGANTGMTRIYAVVDEQLQSAALQLDVVPRPDSLVAATANRVLRDTINYASRTVTVEDTSMALLARVRAPGNVSVGKWIVRYAIAVNGVTLAPTDTNVYAVVEVLNSIPRVMPADTTDAAGNVSRRLRVRVLPGVSLNDSVTISASAHVAAQPLAGSPVQFTVLVRPAATP